MLARNTERNGQSLIKALSYSTCLAGVVTDAAQRGFVQSVFRAAANITFPGAFILSLNALDAPRVPNSLQLSAPNGTFPFSTLRVGMPVLLGAQRLHIEAIALSLDLTYCTRWHPKIIRAQQLHRAIIEKNSAWLAQYVANVSERPPYSSSEHPQEAYTGRVFEREAMACVGTGHPVRGIGNSCGRDEGALCLSLVCLSNPPPGQAQGPLIHIPSSPCPYARTNCLSPQKPTCVSPQGAATSVHDMAQQLCGRGLGLTPTGDDILAGWMAANWLLHGDHPRLLMAYRDILAVAERQTHLLSQCWLRYAAEGYVAEPIGLLLQALTRANEMELATATEAVLALGATSGRDVIHGILLGLAGLPVW